jgi:hypothetical protein
VAAREARAVGIHWAFAPMIDIARDPRWGRGSSKERVGRPPIRRLVAFAITVTADKKPTLTRKELRGLSTGLCAGELGYEALSEKRGL